MAGRSRARRRRIFRRLCLVLLAAILYVLWGNASIETDNAVYTSDALPAVCESHSSATFTARSSARTTPGCTLLWSGPPRI